MPKKKPGHEPKPSIIKAYSNYTFLRSAAARPIRILAEMLEPASRFKKFGIRNTVVFFGSARTLPKDAALANLSSVKEKFQSADKPSGKIRAEYDRAMIDLEMSKYYEAAFQLSKKLSQWFKKISSKTNRFLICSGGGPGIMEAANKGACAANEQSIGLNISLPMEQSPNIYQSKEISSEFHYFFIRKFWFCYQAKAIVVFPGGFGTMDEFFELLTLIQTKKFQKNISVILYGGDFWGELINFDKLVDSRVIDPEDLGLFKIFDDPDETFKYLKKDITKRYLNTKRG